MNGKSKYLPAVLLPSVQHVAPLMFNRSYRQDLALVGGGEVSITRGELVPQAENIKKELDMVESRIRDLETDK